MSAKKERPVSSAIGAALGTWAAYFGDAWAVMYALSLLHRDTPAVPPLSYWASFWSVVAVCWVMGSVASSAAWVAKARWKS
jgi:hypothetical protein